MTPAATTEQHDTATRAMPPALRPGTGDPVGGAVVLTLVHPDFLPPVYALASVLADRGYPVDVVSFSSPAAGQAMSMNGVELHDCGAHAGSALSRFRARQHFGRVAADIVRSARPAAILATCPFSFGVARKLVGAVPMVYLAYELYEAPARDVLRSPLTTFRNWRVLRRLDEASLVSTPSPERSGWLAGHAALSRLPVTILNAPSAALTRASRARVADVSLSRLVPDRIRQGVIVLNTGNVGPTQAILELVDSVAVWPERARLVITNMQDTAYARVVRARVASSPRRDDILLLPLIERQDMLAIQHSATVGVCLLRETTAPETRMPAPNKVGEYLHAGLLVVSNRMPYMDRLAEHGIAVLADALEPTAIGRAVQTAIERSVASDTRQAVRTAADTWYSMEWQARPVLDLLASHSALSTVTSDPHVPAIHAPASPSASTRVDRA
ncbi:MAG: hypothetical protein WKG32_07910 [Gemmatimonadaceae bacterium]